MSFSYPCSQCQRPVDLPSEVPDQDSLKDLLCDDCKRVLDEQPWFLESPLVEEDSEVEPDSKPDVKASPSNSSKPLDAEDESLELEDEPLVLEDSSEDLEDAHTLSADDLDDEEEIEIDDEETLITEDNAQVLSESDRPMIVFSLEDSTIASADQASEMDDRLELEDELNDDELADEAFKERLEEETAEEENAEDGDRAVNDTRGSLEHASVEGTDIEDASHAEARLPYESSSIPSTDEVTPITYDAVPVFAERTSDFIDSRTPEESDANTLRLDHSVAHHRIEPSDSAVGDEEEELALAPDETESSLDWNQVNAAPKRPKKSESSFRKIVAPILGGLAAFPIATLILWYGFGRDIGTVGPTVARYVPWIVPTKLRGNPPRISANPKPKLDLNDSGSEYKNPFRKSESNNRAQPKDEKPESESPRRDPSNSETDANSQPNLTEPAIASEPSVGSDAMETMDTANKQPAETTPDRADPPQDPVESTPDISVTLAQVREMQSSWESTPAAMRTQKVLEFYSAMNQLSERFGKLPARNAKVWKRELASVSQLVLENPKFTKLIQLCTVGNVKGLDTVEVGDWLAVVVDVREWDASDSSNIRCETAEPLVIRSHKTTVAITPEASTGVLVNPGTTTLMLGRVVESEEENWELRVHFLYPKAPAQDASQAN